MSCPRWWLLPVFVLLLAGAGPLAAQPERGWSEEELTGRLFAPRWPEERARALAECRRRGCPEEVWGRILRVLLDEQPPAMEEALIAAEALSESASARSLPLVLELLHSLTRSQRARPLDGLLRATYQRIARRCEPERLDALLVAALGPGEREALARLEAEAQARPDDPLVDLALLVRAVQGRDEVVRRVAARALARQRGARGVELLGRALRGRNQAALEAMAEQGRPEAIPLLTPFLRSHGDPFGEAAALALARLGPDALAQLDRRADSWLLLAEVDPDALVAGLADTTGARRLLAAQGLVRRPDPRALEALTRALEDSYGSVRESALEALERLGPVAAPAAPALVRALQEAREDRTRLRAAAALAAIGSSARGVEPLTQLLSDPDLGRRCAAARALAAADPRGDPDPVALALTSALAQANVELARVALEGLRTLGPRGEVVTSELMGLAARARPARERQGWVSREQVLEVLRAQGAAALRGALQGLDDPDPVQRQVAAELLGQLAGELAWPEPVARALEARLADEDPGVRAAVLAALDALAPRMSWPADEVPGLVAAVESACAGLVPREGLLLLGGLGPAGLDAVERMALVTGPARRETALLVLGRAGGGARLLPLLSEQLAQSDPAAREVAGRVASALAPELPLGFLVEAALREPTRVDLTSVAGQALPLLEKAAAEVTSTRDRRQAFQAMIRLGPAGTLAVLERAASSSDGREVRDAWSALHASRALLDPALVAGALITAPRERTPPLLQLLGPSEAEGAVLAAAVLEALARAEPDPAIGPAAAQMLGRLGPVGAPALLRLLREAQGGDAIHHAASHALRAQALDAPDLLLALLRDPAPGARSAAFTTLSEVAARSPWADLAVDAVVAGLADPDPQVRQVCVTGVGRLRVGAVHADRIAGLLEDPDQGVRLACAQLLAGLGPVTPAVGQALRGTLADDVLGPVVARALRGTRAGQEILRDALGSEDVPLRLRAAEVMSKEGAAAAAELLGRADREQRSMALRALQRLGRGAEEQAPAVSRVLLEDPDEGLRLEAAEVLRACRVGREHQAALARGLADPSPAVRAAVAGVLAVSLARTGECDDEVVQALLTAGRDPELEVRQAVLGVLARLRQRPDVQEALRQMYAQDEDPSLREGARRLLPRPR